MDHSSDGASGMERSAESSHLLLPICRALGRLCDGDDGSRSETLALLETLLCDLVTTRSGAVRDAMLTFVARIRMISPDGGRISIPAVAEAFQALAELEKSLRSSELEPHSPDPNQEDDENRRHFARFLDDVREVCLTVSLPARVLNESYGGMAVRVDGGRPLQHRQRVRVLYKRATTEAEVRWIRPSGDSVDIGFRWT